MGLPNNCEINFYNMFKKGKRNLITDVPGVKVGHITLKDKEKSINTGVTAIIPHMGNLFKNKVLAGVCVINGFGKSAGLVQIEEMGNIETPIIMTNTFGVGTAINALTKYMLSENEDIGVTTGTVNCVVTECNDGELNDIRGMHVTEENVFEALGNCNEVFDEGSVGAGTGMCCFGLKGGIGSTSRVVPCDGGEYTVGVILMSNFGMPGKLILAGRTINTKNEAQLCAKEKGSVIIVIATDLPLNERQLKRVAKRATVALSRTGSFLGNGSGDIVIAFSNANTMPHYSENHIINTKMFHDDAMDKIFEATAEAVEEAVISSMYYSEGVKGIRDKEVFALKNFL